MYDTYSDIFNMRGASYQEAMRRFPKARSKEFQQALAPLRIMPGDLLADIPSGGAYLADWVPSNIEYIALETSDCFRSLAQKRVGSAAHFTSCLSILPFEDNQLDHIVSIAGFHHVNARENVFQELHRVLKPDGTLILADVPEKSAPAGFLNVFVNAHNSGGHAGDFLKANDRHQLSTIGFEIMEDQFQSCPWHFEHVNHMVTFCKLLFGLDRANEDEVMNGIEHWLGYKYITGKVEMQWGLQRLILRKTPPA